MERLSSVFLSTAVSIELFLEFFLLLVLSYTFAQVVGILKSYKKENMTDIEFYVEKKSYLVSLLVSVALVVKIVLVAFFAYALDELSAVVPGAMCVTGVLNTNGYGEVLFPLKLSILIFSSLWLMLNKADLYSKNGLHFKKKMWYFLILYILILLEFIVSLSFFSSIDTQIPVSCCSVNNVQEAVLPLGLSTEMLVGLFYSFYIALVLSAYMKKKLFLFVSSSAFVYLSFYALVYYFGGYIYGAWSHHCAYCMLQKEYSYIGYFIYISLFLSVFYTLGFLIFDFMKAAYVKLILWFSIFVAILSSTLYI